jgi:hypothetical protein
MDFEKLFRNTHKQTLLELEYLFLALCRVDNLFSLVRYFVGGATVFWLSQKEKYG